VRDPDPGMSLHDPDLAGGGRVRNSARGEALLCNTLVNSTN